MCNLAEKSPDASISRRTDDSRESGNWSARPSKRGRKTVRPL